MCNCGQKRQAISRQALSGKVKTTAPHRSTSTWQDIPFIFTGNGYFSVRGNITGKTYFFPRNGAVQIIDYRDVSGLSEMRYLKKQEG